MSKKEAEDSSTLSRPSDWDSNRTARQQLSREWIASGMQTPAIQPKFGSAIRINFQFDADALPSTLRHFPTANLFPEKIVSAIMDIKRGLVDQAVADVQIQEAKIRDRQCLNSVIVETRDVPVPKNKLFYWGEYLRGNQSGRVFASQRWKLMRCKKDEAEYVVHFFHDGDFYFTSAYPANMQDLNDNMDNVDGFVLMVKQRISDSWIGGLFRK
jgi:hypothetical protein